MELNKSNIKKIILIIAFAIAFYLGLKNISSFSGLMKYLSAIFAPIILGLALGFILNVLLRQVENILFKPINKRCKKIWPKIRRPISILVTFILIVGIIAIVILIMIPGIQNTVQKLTANIPPFINDAQNKIKEIQEVYPVTQTFLNNFNFDWNSTIKTVEGYIQGFGGSLLNSTVSVATSFVSGVVTFVFGLIFSIELLSRKEQLKSQTKRVVLAYLPEKVSEKIFKVAYLTNHAFTNFIVGQCTEACILAFLCFIGMNIFGFPYSPLISVFVAFMALIPIFGSFLSAAVGALLILVDSPVKALWFIVFFVVLQQIEGNLIYPRVVGSKVGLPPIWVLAAITIGANTFGLIGMIINIPIFSVIYVLLRENVHKRLTVKLKGKLSSMKADKKGTIGEKSR